MNYENLPLCLSWIATIYLMYYFHEAGHYIFVKLFKLSVTEIHFTKIFSIPVPNAVETEGELNGKDSIVIAKTLCIFLSGPVIGFMPIIVTSSLYPDFVIMLMVYSVYVYGCKNDIFSVYSLLKFRKIDGMEITESGANL